MPATKPDDLWPLHLELIEVKAGAETGRTKPFFGEAVDAKGDRYQVLVKLREPGVHDGTPWRLCLARELIGAIIARHLGLSVPDYAIITVTEPMAHAGRNHPAAGGRLLDNIGANFGSRRIDSALAQACSDPNEWESPMAFDALSFNVDRKPSNPNVLWTGSVLYLIDHGLVAPTWTFEVDGTTAASTYGHVNIRLHAGFPFVQHQGRSFGPCTRSWTQRIDRRFVEWACAQVPSQWASAKELAELSNFLVARAGIADEQARELREVTA